MAGPDLAGASTGVFIYSPRVGGKKKPAGWLDREIRIRLISTDETPNDLLDYLCNSGDGQDPQTMMTAVPEVAVEEEASKPRRKYRISKQKRKKLNKWRRSRPDPFVEVNDELYR